MSAEGKQSWTEANQRYLTVAIEKICERLRAYATAVCGGGEQREGVALGGVWASNRGQMEPPPAIEQLCSIFGMSPFERAVLLACAGMELGSQFAQVYAKVQPKHRMAGPTFGLFLAAFGDAHWDATSPAAALRYWRLIELGSGETLMTSALRIDERILHYLTGTSYLDERLQGIIEPVSNVEVLPQSQQSVAEKAATAWACLSGERRPVLIELSGADRTTREAVAASACASAGLALYRLSASALPLERTGMHTLLRLVEREALLNRNAVLLHYPNNEPPDGARRNAVQLFAEGLNTPLIVATPERHGGYLRQAAFFEIAKPLMEEQRSVWRTALGDFATCLNGSIDTLLVQFNMSSEQIRACSLGAATAADDSAERSMEAIWEACRAQARPSLAELAQRVETNGGWDALVLPQPQLDTLHEIATQMRHRSRVYDAWGFGGRAGRGLGITALFAGASGTGKTTAAEVLAGELKLDLYRIDLSRVVSKYIGETEKSLCRIFDAAEQGGVLLLFDEADALFGRRTEIKDSHDRYANIEVSYLLQRMESYRGLAVLATNMKQALDPAFLRRIRFVVQFPFPDAVLREEIWRRVIPRQAPTEALDLGQLARLSVAGGNIRNIALGAAFHAAKAEEPIGMRHLLKAARSEYLKIEKPLTEREIRGWL